MFAYHILILPHAAKPRAAAQLSQCAAILQSLRPPIGAWLIFHVAEKSTRERWVKLAREHLAPYEPRAKFGAGTDAYFAELNRGRPPLESLDFVVYSINPQVHAFDNASLVETLDALPATIESARQFCGARPVVVSPVTLRPRFNPDATGPAVALPGELPAPVDVRQMSLFGAAWTLGCLKNLAQSGVQSLTFYETTGWRGVMESAAGSPLATFPATFPSLPGTVFPLYHVLADVGEFAGGQVLPGTASDSLKIEGLALRKAGRTRILLANLSHAPQEVALQNLGAQVGARFLDETNAEQAMRAPQDFRSQAGQLLRTSSGRLRLRLLPFALARLDLDC